MVSLKISKSIIDKNILNKSRKISFQRQALHFTEFHCGRGKKRVSEDGGLRRTYLQLKFSSPAFIGLRFTCFSSFVPALLRSAISSLGRRRVRNRGWNSLWFMRNWQYNQCAVCSRWSGAERTDWNGWDG